MYCVAPVGLCMWGLACIVLLLWCSGVSVVVVGASGSSYSHNCCSFCGVTSAGLM